MLEYIKTVLQKVSFSKQLFEKELRKAVRTLVAEELSTLKAWCYDKFGAVYAVILQRCFAGVA